MQNLCRRIEALEKVGCAKRDVHQQIAEKAMSWLWPDDAEQLIRAYGADRVGRPLTERESQAKKKYAEAVERECRWARLRSTPGLDLTRYIGHAFVCVLAFRLSSEELGLCLSGVRAPQEGRTPTEQESAAIQTHNSELERLRLLAGIGSAAMFSELERAADAFKEGRR
jgi:hypothetical protein